MFTYQTTGTLTGVVNDVEAAQDYLADPRMVQYLEPLLRSAIDKIEWRLDDNGHDYSVVAESSRELNEWELKTLSSWVSGQNSDGLGEGFEQQSFAELGGEYGYDEEDEDEDFEMISFDWRTNPCTFVRV